MANNDEQEWRPPVGGFHSGAGLGEGFHGGGFHGPGFGPYPYPYVDGAYPPVIF